MHRICLLFALLLLTAFLLLTGCATRQSEPTEPPSFHNDDTEPTTLNDNFEQTTPDDGYEPDITPQAVEGHLEINQALSNRAVYAEDGVTYEPLTSLVARRSTAVICRAVAPTDDAVLTVQTADGERTYTPDETLSDENNLYFFLDGTEIPVGEVDFHVASKYYTYDRTAVFYETRKLRVLLTTAFAHYEDFAGEPLSNDTEADWSPAVARILSCFPLADDGLEIEYADPIDCSELDFYDQATLQQIKEELIRLKSAGDYDFAVAAVPRKFFWNGVGAYAGMAWDDSNVCFVTESELEGITLHEIAHFYEIGDEYAGGALNLKINPPAGGTKGTDWYDRSKEATSEYYDIKMPITAGLHGNGSLIPEECIPFDVRQRQPLDRAISFMSGGSVDHAWVSSLIWDHLFEEFRISDAP